VTQREPAAGEVLVTQRLAGARLIGRRLAAVATVAVMIWGCGTAPSLPPASTSSAGLGSPAPSQPSSQPGSASPAAPVPVARPVTWSDCGSGFECGQLLVPRDYAAAGGPALVISLIRLPALDRARRIGSLVVNPGGPGGSGTDFVRRSAERLFDDAVRRRFDIVGFDPRGVNRSSEVRCVDDLDHFLASDPTPDTPAELATLLDGERTFAEGCQRRNGDLLPYLGTENVARDLDMLRAALGDAKLSYIGFSYGTLIGALYAQLFPDRIRALVLDGAVDPALDQAGLSEGQALGFEGALRRFLADCAGDRSCVFRHGGKPGPAFDALMRRIEAKPLPAIRFRDARLVGPSYAWSGVVASLYARGSWPILAVGLTLAEAGDGSMFLLLADPLNGRNSDGGYSNLIDAHRAVACVDFPAPRDPAVYQARATAWTRKAPHFGALLAFSDVGCAFWPIPPTRKPAPVSAPGAPPLVVIGTTGDPATPYAWSVALSRQLSSSILVTRRGEGHTGYAYSACVQKAANAYLVALTVPRSGLTCT
jgi:pimeloyl-ACP methyl ester carboxylesterase